MTNVEAEPGFRQPIEDLPQLAYIPPDWLAPIHILDQKPISQMLPPARCEYHVRVHNYREAIPTDGIEFVNHPLFIFNCEPAWSMDGDKGEASEIQIRDG